MNSDFQTYLDQAKNLDPIYYAAAGGILLLLLIWIIFSIIRGGKKRKARAVAPQIALQNMQVAPLGKGVQIKLVNKGHSATILDLEIKKRQDLKITQGYKNYLLDTGKTYSIFLEADGGGRADDGFDMVVEYADQINTIYRQELHIEPKFNVLGAAKVRKYA